MGPLEGHVLGEVRHAALAGQFMAGSGINGDAEIDDIRLSRRTDNAQATGKRICYKHNSNSFNSKFKITPSAVHLSVVCLQDKEQHHFELKKAGSLFWCSSPSFCILT
jgi:hypothetical protein